MQRYLRTSEVWNANARTEDGMAYGNSPSQKVATRIIYIRDPIWPPYILSVEARCLVDRLQMPAQSL